MKQTYKISLIILLIALNTFGQIKSKTLTKKEIKALFPKRKKEQHKIKFKIVKCYKFSDKTGNYYTVLTQNRIQNENTESNYKLYDSIKGYIFKIKEKELTKKVEFKDFLPNEFEETIYHWSKFIDLKDYNNDGIVDPIFVYGTDGQSKSYKILIYYNKNKIILRMTDGISDDERSMKIDKRFYKLPVNLQKGILKTIEELGHKKVTLPGNWKENISKKKLFFENGSNK